MRCRRATGSPSRSSSPSLDIDRSADFVKVFGDRTLEEATAWARLGTFEWRILGRSPTPGAAPPRTSRVMLSVHAGPDKVSSFFNIRVADIQACYELWSREADLSQSRRKSTGRFVATCASLTVTL